MNGIFWDRILRGVVDEMVKDNKDELASWILNGELDLGTYIDEAFLVGADSNYSLYNINLKIDNNYFDKVNSKWSEYNRYIIDYVNKVGIEGIIAEKLEVSLIPPEQQENWRETYIANLPFEEARNQGSLITLGPHTYNGLKFRSKTEIRIAKELDKRDILYFPLPIGVWNGQRKEPDFLIQHPNGRFGILEVMGAPFHPPQKAADDHERGRWFRRKGIIVEFFDATRCYNETSQVIDEFLEILSKNI